MSRLIAIASGKGGVGKTLITASLSVLLQRRGYRVLAADADMGLRNLDLLFGMGDAVRYDASQAARGKCLPRQALVSVCPGLDVLPASQKRTWEKVDVPSFHYVLESLAGEYDYAFVDCPPGRDEAYRAATVRQRPDSVRCRTVAVVTPRCRTGHAVLHETETLSLRRHSQ